MEKEIDRIPKNQDTDIVIRIDDFAGKKGVTIREFVKSERYTGFTKSGLRVPADKFSLFKKAINSINEEELASSIESADSKSAENLSELEKENTKKSTNSKNSKKPKDLPQEPEDIEEQEF